jgi:hypothetical protein
MLLDATGLKLVPDREMMDPSDADEGLNPMAPPISLRPLRKKMTAKPEIRN